MIVAIDDTDSTNGMCTTYLATKIIEELSEYDLVGMPRLVRLNPAVPWKTRGNGAIAFRLGKGRGKKRHIGMIAGRALYSYENGVSWGDPSEIIRRCREVVAKWSKIDEGASPGLIVTPKKPREIFYWDAVRGIVEKSLVEQELTRLGAFKYELAGGRGIIGATAAAAWRPKDRTYEIITYRQEINWGKERLIDEATVKALDHAFPSTFNNYDSDSGRIAIAPHSPCPVLFGIRADDLEELIPAMESIRGERPESWIIYLTNQGTDDHIIVNWKSVEPNRSYAVEGNVASDPVTIKGGHVVFKLKPRRFPQTIDCTAYEPSKGFRYVVRKLRPGDKVIVYGEMREEPRTLNLEKLKVLKLVEARKKVANPLCPNCGRHMKSAGSSAGYRCRRCGTKARVDEAEYSVAERGIREGWYEPPVCSRRHLSKPLKRLASKSLRKIQPVF
ncbi:MAG: tRNA(Ile)(2)-agmatinylcytidine synthase [Methanomassiliicoccales archaeon]